MLPIRGQVDLSRQPRRPTLRQRHTHGTTACPRVAAPAFPRRGQAVLLSPQFCTRSPEHTGGRPGRPRPIPGLPPPGSQREGSLPGGACVCPRKDLVQHNFTTCWHVSINTRLREYLEFQVMQKKKKKVNRASYVQLEGHTGPILSQASPPNRGAPHGRERAEDTPGARRAYVSV